MYGVKTAHDSFFCQVNLSASLMDNIAYIYLIIIILKPCKEKLYN